MSDPKVAIIILHLDDREALRDCLRSCGALTYGNCDIIVVENGSKVAWNLTELKSLASCVTEIVKSPVNLGYARGNNLGIDRALAQGAEYVVLLNDDTEVAPHSLDILVGAGEKDKQVGALCPMIYYFSARHTIWFGGGRFNPVSYELSAPNAGTIDAGGQQELIDSDWLTGCCLVLKRSVLEKLGPLDERFFIYWGDTDFSLRIKKVGFRTVVVPRAHIWHKVSLSTGGDSSPLKAYHKARGELLFAQVHAPRAMLKVYRAILRDIGWLLLKSHDGNRLRKARALVAAVRDYHLGCVDRGPSWLWQ
jgi:GT2 family glycosyltransferase